MVTKKFKLLSLALIFSVSLNIAFLMATLFSLGEKTPVLQTVLRSSKRVPETSNIQAIGAMSRLSFRELVSFLTNQELMEEGYSKRDLAVASLVAFHHFNIERALAITPEETRTIDFNGQKVDLFPALTEDQFEAIIRFAYQEKWPLTSKGLFVQLQARQGQRDESLEQAFFLTPEFCNLQLLFQKTGLAQEQATLLHLACEGTWETLEALTQEQMKVLDFSEEKRRAVLLNYIANHSPTAAHLLLQTDFQYTLKKIEDRTVLDILSLLKQQSEEGMKFCVALLKSARSNAIHNAAAMTLYAYAGELPTAPIDPQAVLARFSSDMQLQKSATPEPVIEIPSVQYHVVQEGESLWKISRQYKVKVDDLIQVNELEKDALFPGMTLKIPH